MASQCILATPPSQGVILNSLLKNASYYKAWLPRLYVGLRECNLDAEMPLLLNPPGAPLACREPLAEFEAVNAHFSAQEHAFFHVLHDLQDMSEKQSSDGEDECTRDDDIFAGRQPGRLRALPIMERINPLAPGVCLASPTAEDALPSRRRAVHVVHVAALRGASSRG